MTKKLLVILLLNLLIAAGLGALIYNAVCGSSENDGQPAVTSPADPTEEKSPKADRRLVRVRLSWDGMGYVFSRGTRVDINTPLRLEGYRTIVPNAEIIDVNQTDTHSAVVTIEVTSEEAVKFERESQGESSWPVLRPAP